MRGTLIKVAMAAMLFGVGFWLAPRVWLGQVYGRWSYWPSLTASGPIDDPEVVLGTLIWRAREGRRPGASWRANIAASEKLRPMVDDYRLWRLGTLSGAEAFRPIPDGQPESKTPFATVARIATRWCPGRGLHGRPVLGDSDAVEQDAEAAPRTAAWCAALADGLLVLGMIVAALSLHARAQLSAATDEIQRAMGLAW